jgi:putative hemolysin
VNEIAIYWFFVTLLCVSVQAFFSMQEMAIISINRVDLNYYLSLGSRRARWVSFLLNHPDFLFTTTLLMVNGSLQLGSECSRRFYTSLNLSTNWAPISQVIIVVIVAELAPMFAARQHPRQVSFFGVPLVYFISILIKPLVWLVGLLSKRLHKTLGGEEGETNLLFSREDLKSVFMRIDHSSEEGYNRNFIDFVSSNILALRSIKVCDVAQDRDSITSLSAGQTVKEAKKIFEKISGSHILVYERFSNQISGYLRPRFLMATSPSLPLHQVARPPFFVFKGTPILEVSTLLKESRHSIAVVIDAHGNGVGVFTFKHLARFLFGLKDSIVSYDHSIVEKTFESHVKIGQLKKMYPLEIEAPDQQSLSELVCSHLDHPPHKGDVVVVGKISFIVEEASILEPKWIRVKGRIKKKEAKSIDVALEHKH